MKLQQEKVSLILPANIKRSLAYITVVNDTTIYIAGSELESAREYESNRGFPISLYGVHEIRGYKGNVFGVSTGGTADVRVIEYEAI